MYINKILWDKTTLFDKVKKNIETKNGKLEKIIKNNKIKEDIQQGEVKVIIKPLFFYNNKILKVLKVYIKDVISNEKYFNNMTAEEKTKLVVMYDNLKDVHINFYIIGVLYTYACMLTHFEKGILLYEKEEKVIDIINTEIDDNLTHIELYDKTYGSKIQGNVDFATCKTTNKNTNFEVKSLKKFKNEANILTESAFKNKVIEKKYYEIEDHLDKYGLD